MRGPYGSRHRCLIYLFSFIIFVTWLVINKILSTRQINSNTLQKSNMQLLHLKLQVVYASMYIALCLTDSQWSLSLNVLEWNIIRHKILRMLKFHPITAFMKTYPNFKKIFLIRVFWFKYISPIIFKIGILD